MPKKQNQNKQIGATLVELIVLIAIISIVFGMSSGLFTRFSQKFILPNSVQTIRNIIKYGQAYSKQENSYAKINFYKEHKSIQLWCGKIEHHWHMEDINAQTQNIKLVLGKIGNGYSFSKNSYYKAGKDLRKITPQGTFRISFWFFPRRSPFKSSQILWEAGNIFKLGITPDNHIFAMQYNNIIKSRNPISLYQWHHIEYVQELDQMILYLNKIPVNQLSCKIYPPKEALPMVFGKQYQGYIDEAHLVIPQLRYTWTWPDNIEVQISNKNIYIDNHGKINLQYHGQDIPIQLTEIEAKKNTNYFIDYFRKSYYSRRKKSRKT